MEHYYLDASALVKAYLWEEGTADVLRIVQESRAEPPTVRLVTSRIAYAEAMSAVARREANGALATEDADAIAVRLMMDFVGPATPFDVIEPSAGVIRHAVELVREHRLRALDAIHLASGLSVRHGLPDRARFRLASADRRLNLAAARENLAVFNPEGPAGHGGATPPT